MSNNNNPVTFKNGAELCFEEDDKLSLSCTVKGGHPAPEVSVTVGEKNITELFDREEVSQQEFLEVHGLVRMTHDVNLTLKEDMSIGYRHAKKEVACQAHLPGRDVVQSSSFSIGLSGGSECILRYLVEFVAKWGIQCSISVF